jgi:hypothetical protein
MDDMIELRCKFCGAPLPLDAIKSDSPYVTCECCGSTQQRVDAKEYMDQMMGEIKAWMSKAIPGGYSMIQHESVDPIARHNIYMNSVKPMLDIEIKEYRFALNTAASSSLIVLPFNTGTPVRCQHTSAQAFEFNAKLKGVEPLAVDQDSRDAIHEAQGISLAYAMIISNSKLLSETTPGRFALMSKNFKEASGALAKCKGYEPLSERLDGLSEVCTASDLVLNGDQFGCMQYIDTGIPKLEKAKTDILTNPKLAMMIRAVDIEINQSKTLKGITEGSVSNGSRDALGTLELINRISSVPYPSVPGWEVLKMSKERDKELLSNVESIVSSRGGGTIPICVGEGDTLYPFWDVDLTYSFTTGALFSKKAVEVTEDILVPATFTLSATALRDPSYALTDIFARGGNSFSDRVSGNETSISGGKGIGKLTDSAVNSSPGGKKVVVPLSTKTEAMRIVEEYLKRTTSTNSKLRLSRPTVQKLVYVPCKMNGSVPALPREFDGMVPRVLSDPALASIVTI